MHCFHATQVSVKNTETNKAIQDSVQSYLDAYNKTYKELNIISNEASWMTQIRIVEGDSTNSVANNKAQEAYAKFTGSTENIEMAKKYLIQQEQLTPLQVKQLKAIFIQSGKQSRNTSRFS